MTNRLLRELRSAAVVLAVVTALLGLGYPALMTAFAQTVFPSQANGSLITRDGRIVGSRLVAQGFTSARYFHERPSATTPAYNAAATTFSNLGPTDPALAAEVQAQITAILKLERPYDHALTARDIPVDAVVPSGSGVDPEISIAYAELQARRVAALRHLSLPVVDSLIERYTDGRSLGLLGEPGVNVLELNLALDRTGER